MLTCTSHGSRSRNVEIRPTTIPRTLKAQIEQVRRPRGLRLAFDHHKSLARGLKAARPKQGWSWIKPQARPPSARAGYDRRQRRGLSQYPHRARSALMMLDAYLPEGYVTILARTPSS
jgi:hypothetical protein